MAEPIQSMATGPTPPGSKTPRKSCDLREVLGGRELSGHERMSQRGTWLSCPDSDPRRPFPGHNRAPRYGLREARDADRTGKTPWVKAPRPQFLATLRRDLNSLHPFHPFRPVLVTGYQPDGIPVFAGQGLPIHLVGQEDPVSHSVFQR